MRAPPTSGEPGPPLHARPALARLCLLIGLAGGVLAALGLLRGWRGVEDQAYLLAWSATLLVLDAVVHLRTGRSLLLSTPRTFGLLAAWSAAFWLVFELANLRLENWHYVGVPPDALARSLGAWLCFATVLPALFECADLVRSLGVFARVRHRPLVIGQNGLRLLAAAGVLSLVLPLAWPRAFFPLIWAFAVLCAEPWLFARGERGGLLERLAAGDPRRALELLAGGALAGIFWELHNAPAVARWVYTVPGFVSQGPLEMPWAGFLGFPPFALEGWSVACVLVALGLLPALESVGRARAESAARVRAALLGSLVFSALALALVNRCTVRSTDATLRELPAVEARLAVALEARGLRRARDLLGPAGLEALAPLADTEREAVLREARLVSTAGLGTRGRLWLLAAGVADVQALAAADPEQLAARMTPFAPRPLGVLGALPAPPPSPAEIGHWVRDARGARTPTSQSPTGRD